GGGGGGGGGGAVAAGNSAFVVIRNFSPPTPAIATIHNSEIPVETVKIGVASEIQQSSVQVTALKEQPSSVSSVGNTVYRYLEITTGIQAKDIVSAEVTFTVDRGWLLENGILKDDVALWRFNAGKWVEMPTRYLMQQNNSHYYAASVGGFSVFAISVKEKKEIPKPAENKTEVKAPEVSWMAATEQPEGPVEKPESLFAKVSILVLGILFGLIIGAALFMHHKHRKK
ncbi:MAG TPA: PGF-pre-PGF domain-containing protein, partial [Nanoarchaeota archaeon]|nr:PGF-pre-PGF domain-containing protein [Nanoarchaeota archaeon]